MKSDTEFICPNPNCDYQGKPELEGYGSAFVLLILIICGLVPGIIYWAMCMGMKYICPKCKMIQDKE